MVKFTKHNLKKLEELFETMAYAIRYERGNFNAGYCIVENQRVVVINKFYDTEGRMNCLVDILGSIEIDPEKFDDKQAKFYRQLLRMNATEEEQEEETEQEDESVVS